MAKNRIDKAIETVPGFKRMFAKYIQYMQLHQRSEQTIRSYSYRFASICLHFGRTPETYTADEINDYLGYVMQQDKMNSTSSFKHIVYSLKLFYKFMNIQPPKNLTLPKLSKEQRLPIVLSFDETRDILTKTKDLREKTILAMLYSCGLRQSELRNLRIEDIDFARNLVYIRQAKGKKTRCIELGQNMKKVLDKYMSVYKPKNYIFTLEYTDLPMGKDALRGLVNRCAERSGITKHLTPHIFRHTYATHLLEMGVSIYRLKELLGHSNIINTMVYLHIINPVEEVSFSPIDRLFPVK